MSCRLWDPRIGLKVSIYDGRGLESLQFGVKWGVTFGFIQTEYGNEVQDMFPCNPATVASQVATPPAAPSPGSTPATV